ncbi:hypothetical protein GQF56_23280 [Rhodobacter sphaeroides]|jgi:hypothetical protein|uniref:Uncharacterized protein n=1 Tax=Cereibacter sphaeroides (strain ATCC 17023 / DSM 158 / JCM 6121 / CCUG 31486 / LMG 2827 / NBRC 12203 / NCIMB 8253 / ATH 2.4.1.) TaxID=272943 RepID=U5NRS4_CERS4|nr:hypothetical protein [Cereibacter sphaeroides]AGY32500.1 hypothetical protein RSP_7673 [Cereibacter sphaeroides 2.4.1]AXC64140.1 hypothetical protein DQL45_22445 [Cereibacter sphaeroides 2.4.1]MVX50728.1 hypothetical protein [Cereibacter sphaeroides]QJC86859.1 hypothetical protein HGN32_22030 [Cereibacter sphaeroides]
MKASRTRRPRIRLNNPMTGWAIDAEGHAAIFGVIVIMMGPPLLAMAVKLLHP